LAWPRSPQTAFKRVLRCFAAHLTFLTGLFSLWRPGRQGLVQIADAKKTDKQVKQDKRTKAETAQAKGCGQKAGKRKSRKEGSDSRTGWYTISLFYISPPYIPNLYILVSISLFFSILDVSKFFS
jgi:hypothetical protein